MVYVPEGEVEFLSKVFLIPALRALVVWPMEFPLKYP